MNFDFNIITTLLVPIIVVGCLCVGYILKKWMPLDDKFIPTILFVVGAVGACLLDGFSVESAVAGMLSALASTGLHQVFYQYMKIEPTAKIEADEMGPGNDEEE